MWPDTLFGKPIVFSDRLPDGPLVTHRVDSLYRTRCGFEIEHPKAVYAYTLKAKEVTCQECVKMSILR